MDAESNVSRAELFAWAVRKRHIPVESAVGLYVVHKQFGQGQILAVDRSQSGYVVQIRFHDMPSSTGTKKFLSRALWPGPITDMQLPRVLDTDDSTTLQAAFLTTRAAALADMERWAEAKQLGARAAGSAPGGGHAYNVLGRIDHETGAHDRAGCYFAVAQGRAKPVPTDPDAALRARVTEMAPAARVSIARYLLGRDSERFRWVRPYLQETGSEENPQ